MDDDDSKMSSESENELSDEEEKEFMKRAEEIEGLLSANKYLYDLHVELVGLYKKLIDLSSLRQAYERFYKTYPLTATLWLDWLNDEMQLASTEEEKAKVLELFSIATKDYISVQLWLEYAQYALGICSLDETRTILESALNAAGLHVSNGSLLWDTLRELELANLSLTTPGTEEYTNQLQRVVDIFKRQLSVPLLNMESTYSEWTEFLKQLPDANIDTKPIEWGYKNALKTLENYKPFEDSLLVANTDEEFLDIFKKYIKSVKDPSFILCLYERAVEKLCLIPDVWLDYCYYAFKLGDCAVKISERAVRNVTWNEELWVLRLRILEKYEQGESETLKCYQDGIASIQGGLELWTSYLDYIKRNAPDRLMKLFETAEDQLTNEIDPSYKITRLHARILVKQDNYQTARTLWNGIMQDQECKKMCHFWMEFINLEKQFGTIPLTRELFNRAINSCKDYPQTIIDEWVLFEREFGTVDDIVKCSEKVRGIPQVLQYVEEEDKKRRNDFEERPMKKFRGDDRSFGDNKRKRRDFDDKRGRDFGERRKHDEENGSKNFDRKQDYNNKHKEFGNKHKEKQQNEEEILVKNQGAPADLDPLKSVFISNLNPHVTQKQLQTVFPNGKITLSTNNRGQSRCFGYVQFETEEEATTTLARDREPFEGRPIFISKCKTDKTEREKMFKYPDKLELNKLFVKGLPIKHTKEDVEDIFKEFNCTDVRLVFHKSGQSKGLAYVDFSNEKDAENALKATNQMKIDEFVITVAISAPPSKKKSFEDSLFKPHMKPPSLFIPRSVKKVVEKNGDDKNSDVAKEAVTKKSNDDFRKMFLK